MRHLLDNWSSALWLACLITVTACGDDTTQLNPPRVDAGAVDAIAPRPVDAPHSPTPSSGSIDIEIDTTLAWSPSSNARSYRVWLSTDLTEVSEVASMPAYTVTESTMSPEELLIPGETYYWRVEAIGEELSTLGNVWTFSTDEAFQPLPDTPTIVAPGPDATDIPVTTPLTWTEADHAVSYSVFLSKELGDVVAGAMSALQATTGDTNFTPESALDLGMRYYWRVEAVNDNGKTSSNVASFTTSFPAIPEKSSAPMPETLAEDITLDVGLSWTGDEVATSFDLYVGRDARALIVATQDSPEFVGTTNLPEAAFPFVIDYGETWYWRVDAKNLSGITRGEVWNFTTEGETAPPRFSGVRTGLALGEHLLIGWNTAQDDDDANSLLSYQVFVWSADETPDWTTPIETVNDDTKIILGRDTLGTRLDADMIVAVRSVDSEGYADDNTVTIKVPSTIGLPKLYASHDGTGDGNTPSTPGSLANMTAAAATGGVVLLLPGEYENASASVSLMNEPLVMVGGIDYTALGDAPSALSLLEQWRPMTTPTALVRPLTPKPEPNQEGVIIDPTQTPMLSLGGLGSAFITGIHFEDPDALTINVDGPSVTLTASVVTHNYDESAEGERAFSNGAVVRMPLGSGTVDATVVGNTFRYLTTVVVAGNRLNRFNFSNNTLTFIAKEAIRSSFETSVADGTEVARPWLIGAGGTLALNIQRNHGYRVYQMTDITFAPEDVSTGGQLTVDIINNHIRGVRSDCFEFNDFAHVGSDGESRLTIRDNFILGTSSEMIDVELAPSITDPESDESYAGYFDGPVRVEIVDNQFYHGNGTAVALSDANVGTHDLDVQFHRNQVMYFEGEGLKIRSSLTDSRPTSRNGRMRVIAEDNFFEGPDGAFEFYLEPILDGETDLQFRRNTILHDHDYGHRITATNHDWSASALDNIWDRNIVVEDNYYSGEDEIVWYSLEPHGGSTVLKIDHNEIYASDDGIRISMVDVLDELSAEDALTYHQGGSLDVRITNNTIFAEDQGIEAEFASLQDTSSITISGNTISSMDDSFDIDSRDIQHFLMQDNKVRSFDYDAANLSFKFARSQHAECTVILFNNRFRGTDDAGIELFFAEANTTFASEGTSYRANLYAAHNDVTGSNESEAFSIDSTVNGNWLLERNFAGYNDVDSSPALDLRCPSASKPFLRTRNNVFAFGAGDGIDADRCGGQYTNNTVAYNNRESTSRSGLNVYDDSPEAEGGLVFGQLASHSNIFAFNSGNDLDSNSVLEAPYSLVTQYLYGTPASIGMLSQDPRFTHCDNYREAHECFSLQAESPAVNAGHPGEHWRNQDGSRNTMGAFGGPWAGEVGPSAEPSELPIVLLGLRNVANLSMGNSLMPVDKMIEVLFSLPVDSNTIDDGLVVEDTLGQTVAGQWSVDGQVVTFTPSEAYAAGTTYRVVASESIRGTTGERLIYRDWVGFTTAPLVTNESDNEVTIIAPGIFTIDGEMNNLSDPVDAYSLDVNAGDRLAMSVFASRLYQGADVGLRILDISGETVFDQSFRYFENEDSDDHVDPYISHVFGETETVRIEVFVSNDGTNIEGEVTQPYRLEGILAPF